MTAEEKEIRDAERKALAEVRSWRRQLQKEMEGMTREEQRAFITNGAKSPHPGEGNIAAK